MVKNIWEKLKSKRMVRGSHHLRPIICLAPMHEVTDSAFRQIIASKGRPDLFFSEFVSVDGLANPEGRAKLLRELYFDKTEKPILAQIFGRDPKKFEMAAKLIKKLGFDGIDINMGCPDRAILKQKAGSYLINEPKLAQEIIEATKRGAGGLPVSVKTRIGFKTVDDGKWAKTLIDAKPAAITFHLRTTKELSKVPAEWDRIKKAVALAKGTGVLILGNGDVKDLADARAKAEQYGLDGIMIGRAVFGNPWVFTDKIPTIKEKLQTLVKHAKLFEKLYGKTPTNKKLFGGHIKSFAVMKKHFKSYVGNFPGASELRAKLMQAENAKGVGEIIDKYLKRA